MTYNSPPDAESVRNLAEALKTDWGRQSTLDNAMLSYLLVQNKQDVNKPNPDSVKGFRSGIGGLIVKEDAALLTVTPGLHMNVPTDDEDDKTHASLLENWGAGAWKASQQAGQVWYRKPQDLRGLGRAWSNVYPNPRLWGTPEYEKLLEAYRTAVDGKDPEEIKAAEKAIALFKRDRWPIRWRYVAPRQTWTTFTGDMWLPEVVEIRKMTRLQLETEYGKEKLPAEYYGSGMTSGTAIDVYEYANHEYCAVVIGSKKEPKIAHEYRHSLGMSPYILCEAELLPDNDSGWRWAGALFYAQDMIDTFDGVLADLVENHRDNTRTPLLIKLNRDTYDEDVKVAGRPKQIELKPGSQHTMWTDEGVELAPVPQINAQSIQLLQEMKQLIYQSMIRPVERGEAKSGTSQNQFVTAVQIAEREFDPSMKALNLAAENFGKLAFRCVLSLNKEWPDYPDKVAVFVEKGLIEVGPKDVIGWENGWQGVGSRAIPIDRNLILAQAQSEKALGIAPETWMEATLGYQDPQGEMRKARRAQLADAMFQSVVLPAAIQWAQQQALQPTQGELGQVQQMLPQASPGLQQFAAGSGIAGTEVPPGVLQAQANVGRTGVPQIPQTPTEMVMPQ